MAQIKSGKPEARLHFVRETMHGRALERAALLLGGEVALALYLGLSGPRLALYLNGTARCPPEVSRKVVRVLLEEDLRAAGAKQERTQKERERLQ
jgi:DNA-binding transcriptional regulator YdaS (Cro superfamily)